MRRPTPRGPNPGSGGEHNGCTCRACRALYGVCARCQCVVRIDKPILGSLHICRQSEDQR